MVQTGRAKQKSWASQKNLDEHKEEVQASALAEPFHAGLSNHTGSLVQQLCVTIRASTFSGSLLSINLRFLRFAAGIISTAETAGLVACCAEPGAGEGGRTVPAGNTAAGLAMAPACFAWGL